MLCLWKGTIIEIHWDVNNTKLQVSFMNSIPNNRKHHDTINYKVSKRTKNNLKCAFDSVISHPHECSGDQETYMTSHRSYRGIGFSYTTWLELHRALTPYFYNYQHPHSVRSITFLSSGNPTVCEVCHLQWSFAWNHTRLICCRVDLRWMLLEQEMKWIWFAPQRKMSVPALSEWFYKNIPKHTPVYWVLSRVYTATTKKGLYRLRRHRKRVVKGATW